MPRNEALIDWGISRIPLGFGCTLRLGGLLKIDPHRTHLRV
jgi:hypothetical protein